MKKLIARDSEGRYGLVAINGDIILDAIYDEIKISDDEYIAVKQYGKWGFLNQDLSWVISPRYEEVNLFSSGGVAAVKFNSRPGSWGLINRLGEALAMPYDYGYYAISEFNSEGVALAKHYLSYVLIDASGQHLNNDKRYSELSWHERDQLFLGLPFGKTIVINENEDIVVYSKKDYDEIYFESAGLHQVVKNELVGYMDKTGKEVIPCQFLLAYEFSIDGLAPAQTKSEKFGFINRDGQFVIEPIYDDASLFNFGRAPVSKDGEWYFIDIHGNSVFDKTFQEANRFMENGLAFVTFKDGQAGFINLSGEVVFYVNPDWRIDGGFNQHDDLLAFHDGEYFGILNREGEILVNPVFDSLEFSTHHDLHCFRRGDRYGYVSSEGQIIITNIFKKAGPFGTSGKAPVIFDDLESDESYVGVLDSNGDIEQILAPADVILDIGSSASSAIFWAKDSDGEYFYLKPDEDGSYEFDPTEARLYYKFASRFNSGEAIVDLFTSYTLLDSSGQELPFTIDKMLPDGSCLVDFPYD